MARPPITSPANPLVKELARLRKRRGRDAAGRFLIEGVREVERAAAAGVALERVLVAPDLLTDPGRALTAQLETNAPAVELGARAFGKLSNRQSPDGVVAVARSASRGLGDLILPLEPLVLVAEGIEKPGNLGAMLRTADGAGVDAVIVTGAAADLTNPNVIRASQGAVFSVPTAVAASIEAVDFLSASAVAIVALDPAAGTTLWDIDLRGPTAIAVGNEAAGLSDEIRGRGIRVRLPMRGSADSLNASVAAALALYEAVRQRG